MSGGKDSVEVLEFMTLFSKLKEWCDDEPEDLSETAARDEGIDDICKKLWFAASDLENAERQEPELFARPVDPNFIAAWRDYEVRYASAVASIWLGAFAEDFAAEKCPSSEHLGQLSV